MYSGDEYLIAQVKAVIHRTAETICGIGKEQDKEYCSASADRTQQPMETSPWTLLVDQQEATPPSLRGEELQVREVSRKGQLMHHFVSLVPTYESIAGSEQLGPNIFWTLTALRYASITSDTDWLNTMLPYIELSARFLISFFDPSMGLLKSPGPLWIDVVVRENYTRYTRFSYALIPHTF